MTPLAHYQFAPWAVDGDRRIVAAEDQWAKAMEWNEQARTTGERQRVEVTVDVFEGYRGLVYNSDGEDLSVCELCGGLHVDRNDPAQYCSCGKWVSRMDELRLSAVRNSLFGLIDATPHLDWLLTTSHPKNCWPMIDECDLGLGEDCASAFAEDYPNLWLGVHVSNQQDADERIPHLLKVPAAVRFVRCVPREEINLHNHLCRYANPTCPEHKWSNRWCDPSGFIHLVIVSGESGPNARPCHPDWVRSLRDQCTGAGVAFYFVGWGSWTPDGHWPSHDQTWMGDEVLYRLDKGWTDKWLDSRTWDQLPQLEGAK